MVKTGFKLVMSLNVQRLFCNLQFIKFWTAFLGTSCSVISPMLAKIENVPPSVLQLLVLFPHPHLSSQSPVHVKSNLKFTLNGLLINAKTNLFYLKLKV